MIARDAIDRQAQRREQLTKILVSAAAVVLNEVTGYDDEIGLPVTVSVMRKYGFERCVSHSTAQAATDVGKQVWVCQVQYAECFVGIVNEPGPRSLSIACAIIAACGGA